MTSPRTGGNSIWDWTGPAFVFGVGLSWLARQSPADAIDCALPLALISFGLEIWGRVFLVGTGVSRWIPRSLPLTLLTGAVLVSGLTLIGRWIGGLDTGFLAGAIWVAGFVGYFLLRVPIARWRSGPGAARSGLWVVIFSLLGATLWTDYFRPAFGPVEDQYSFKFIRDYFYHGQMILLHATPVSPGEWGSPGLARHPNPLYHYAGYCLAGILCRLSGLPVMDALTGFWLPFGLFLVNLAVGVLATEWFGRRAALAAVLVIGIVPDPTLLPTLVGLPAGFSYYSLDRFLVLSPSSAYGVAAAGLAIALLGVAARRGSLAPLGAGAGLGALALFFKAQCFLPAALLGAPLALFALHSCRQRYQALRSALVWPLFALLVVGVLGAAALAWPTFRERAPPVALAQPPGGELVEFFLPRLPPRSIEHWLARYSLDRDDGVALVVRAALVLYVPLQIMGSALVLAALLVDSWPRRGVAKLATWKRSIPWVAILAYLGLALLPAPNRSFVVWGNPWDYQLVPFAWTTVILLTWSIGRLVATLPRRWPRGRGWLVVGLILALLVAPFARRRLPDDGLADQAWGHFTAPRGLVECARFLRAHAAPGDLIQDSRDDGEMLVEPFAERRAWVGWPLVASMTGSSPVLDLFNARRERHAQFRWATSREPIRRFAGDTGVRWYLLSPHSSVAWRPWAGDAAVFEARGHLVIDLEKLAERVPVESNP